MLRQISLGSIALALGLAITTIGFWAYFTDQATLNLAGFFYGIPILLIGLALRTAQLKPVPYSVTSSTETIAARSRATETQNQIRDDVTRFRYAQEAHLIEALETLGLSPTKDERPVLTSIRETLTDGAYTLVLEFDSPLISLATWQAKCPKMTGFFGPNVRVEVEQPEEEYIDVLLISTLTPANPISSANSESPAS